MYGQAAYTGRYRDAIEQASLDYQTLRNYAWVARRFPCPAGGTISARGWGRPGH